MNYYQYKRRAPARRRGSDYLKPFIFIIVFLLAIYAGWKLLNFIFKGEGSNTSEQTVLLELESGSAKAMTAEASEWKTIPSNISLYEGEKVRTQSDGRLTLTFFDDTVARLDKSSEVELQRMREEDGSSQIELLVNDGSVWINNMDVLSNQDFSVITPNFIAHANNGTVFAVTAPNSLYVIKGSVQTDIMQGKELIKSTTVGVGQQLLLTESLITDLSEGLNKDFLFALDDNFKTSNWYRWNVQKEEGSLGLDSEDDSSIEEDNTTTETEEGDASTEEEKTEEDPEETTDENDTEAPTTPKITSPGENGEKVTLDKTVQIISGSVSSDTTRVVVNGYQLQKYTTGSKTFSYTASHALKNLLAGENTYSVIAYDKAGNKSDAATITLVLPQSVIDDSEEATTEETTNEEPATNTGEVKITSPNGGEKLVTSEEAFVISGTVPTNTAKVLVNGYQLQGYQAGGTSYKYNATVALGTLKTGVNTYVVNAYDKEGGLIGSDSMTIELQTNAEPETQDPPANNDNADLTLSITLPTSAANYQTTLNEVVLGGNVSASVEKVFVNGVEVPGFVPGTGEWKMNVQLQAGANVYSVYGEKDGQKTNTDSITINYQN